MQNRKPEAIWKIWLYLNILVSPSQRGRISRWKNQFTEDAIENLRRVGKESNLIFHCETHERCTHFVYFPRKMQIVIIIYMFLRSQL